MPTFPSRGFELIENYYNYTEEIYAPRSNPRARGKSLLCVIILSNRFFPGSGHSFRTRRFCELSVARADRANFAVRAIRISCVTSAPTMPDQPVAEVCPLRPRDQPHEICLNFFGLVLRRKIETFGQSSDMRVNDDSFFNRKCIPEH